MEDLKYSNQEFFKFKNLKAIRLKNQQKQNFQGGIIIAKELEEALQPTNDYIFKRIFGQKGNEEITKGLINSILDEKVENIDLSESPILEKDLKDDKVGILDIKARLDNNVLCNIEMQVVKYSNIEKRIMYYWSKLYAGEIIVLTNVLEIHIKGEIIGKLKGKIEDAKKMLELNIPIEKIIEITGLSKEEIENIY